MICRAVDQARRALKALRGIVRQQELVRGRLVRRQLAFTLSRMEALLRVQERAAPPTLNHRTSTAVPIRSGNLRYISFWTECAFAIPDSINDLCSSRSCKFDRVALCPVAREFDRIALRHVEEFLFLFITVQIILMHLQLSRVWHILAD